MKNLMVLIIFVPGNAGTCVLKRQSKNGEPTKEIREKNRIDVLVLP